MNSRAHQRRSPAACHAQKLQVAQSRGMPGLPSRNRMRDLAGFRLIGGLLHVKN